MSDQSTHHSQNYPQKLVAPLTYLPGGEESQATNSYVIVADVADTHGSGPYRLTPWRFESS